MSHHSNHSDHTKAVESPDSDQPAVRHSWEEPEQPSVTIVKAVSAVTERAVTELPPLREGADPDTIDALLTHGGSSRVRISFDYADTVVVATGNGTIEVRVADAAVGGE